jgi:hypothetical protein
MKRDNLLWIGTLEALPNIKIYLYTTSKFGLYMAKFYEHDNPNPYKEIKTRSWKRFMEMLQKELVSYVIIDSSKNLWVDRWLWTNKPLHEYILNY